MPTDLQDIATALHAVAGAIRDTAPKPGPHVVGGPPPKPGERTEADYLREEVREIRAALKAEQAAHAEAKLAILNKVTNRTHDACPECDQTNGHLHECAIGQARSEVFFEGVQDERSNHAAALAEARAQARREALEEAVTELRRLAEHADLIAHDHRHSDIPDHVAAREWERRAATVRECAAAIRALAPAQKGGEDA